MAPVKQHMDTLHRDPMKISLGVRYARMGSRKLMKEAWDSMSSRYLENCSLENPC